MYAIVTQLNPSPGVRQVLWSMCHGDSRDSLCSVAQEREEAWGCVLCYRDIVPSLAGTLHVL